ncbi:TadE/TadG family type IV pilus assembly protein [Salinivibrio kushneri]|uniref:VWFA domain-containing protein n=2 Tax=Salinivibrio kushneri TaxID=1908198 RepID=A0AB36JV41_9GAMM|nr:TadE/TadG family type IV pilus assembly protein [Salinivibrio kushneri]OOE34365.1 hypothetical protein BZG05_07885 [Salinivibrio kushneri]OOE37685.1 hypothetical protein BZG04_02720 [Salinivibrio kushneri]OOE38879.1 hypothetical protein BZG00_11860 [Salinivibrio kushneri]OOE52366.1 hypothetical protein BZG12_10610 [Salinivibrio kushneri]QCP02805.1 pilus assembly protein [Salinivibrio kushneri]
MRSQQGFAHSAPGYYRQQQGHAAILFALFIPILFGIFTLGTDGARAVQDKARLEEAVEVATLAIAGQNADDINVQRETAKAYIAYYFPQARIIDNELQITKISCDINPSCDETDPNQQPFFEYQLRANLEQPSWFPGNEAIIGFDDDYGVAGQSVARKYQSEAVDVVLVSDFSASMYNNWTGGSQQKYQDLKDIIAEVADEIKKYNSFFSEVENRIAFVGYDFYSSHWFNSRRKFVRHLKFSSYSNYGPNESLPGSRPNDIDYSGTVDDVFFMNSSAHEALDEWEVTNVSYFYDLPLTSNVEGFKSNVSQFSVPASGGSGTSSYAGIIRGAQILKEGTNPRRLLLVLSDGEDSYRTVTQRLIDEGLCSTIYDELNESKDGVSIKARMVVVGFDYDVFEHPELKNCVGGENIYQAQDRAAIKNKILELISEEIGHLAP